MHIAVAGDLIEDIFIYGSCNRLNPEGPVPLVSNIKTIKSIGGAGNVVENLKSLGIYPDFYHSSSRPSTKTRINANGQIICRLDDDVFSPEIDTSFALQDYDLIVLSDYNKGALRDCREIIARSNCKVLVDPKKKFHNYTGAYCIKPNQLEFEKYYGAVSEQNLKKFAKENRHELVIVTLGQNGLIYYHENEVYQIPSITQSVADVTGAGDCFMAGLIYGLCKGYDVHKSIQIGNIGAGISVTHYGTYVLQRSDLIQTKVFTNGCFDILHRGHIELLEQSKRMGDYLIVGINSDESVKRLKGASRPINNQEDRKKALESLKFVDEVIIFDEDTPYELIKTIKPDIITKGGDYTVESVIGNDLAIVNIISLIEGHSTTKIIGEL
jgi:D-beta-D-heptose 7-phosphate kinase/D-beta-D-heptose 1-phosphate adenosyltransferase